MNGVVQERKDKVMLFILSLPVSTTQYLVAKVAANAIAFLVPWLVLTVATFAVIDVSAIPNGLLPYWLAVLVYILFYYCVLLAVGLVTGTPPAARDGDHRSATFRSTSSFHFCSGCPRWPRMPRADTAVWTGDIVAIIAHRACCGRCRRLVPPSTFGRAPADFV